MEDRNRSYLGVGICFGVVFGLIYKNIAIGIAIGLAIGVSIDNKKKKKQINKVNINYENTVLFNRICGIF